MLSRTIFLIFIYIPIFLAAPTSNNDTEAKVVDYENNNDGSGNYYFRYVTSNGISREETGTLVNAGKSDAHIEVKGTVSYINPDGDFISVRYYADENGYHTRILPEEYDVQLGEAGLQVGVGVFSQIVASLLGGSG